MTNKIINCKELLEKEIFEIRSITQKSETDIVLDNGYAVNGLTILQVGDNAASNAYVSGKIKDCEKCGIYSVHKKFNEDITEEFLIDQIKESNTSAIIVQLPLPKSFDTQKILNTIPVEKDVDGLTDGSKLALLKKEAKFIPCTALACMKIIDSCIDDIAGLHAVIVGRSDLVGKPVAELLLQRNATVTICHSKTKNLKEICSQADILISAVGKPHLITSDMVKDDSIVIDVGITRLDTGKLCGDVDFDNVVEKVKYITTVPGGVGLMTRAMLMHNTIKSFNF